MAKFRPIWSQCSAGKLEQDILEWLLTRMHRMFLSPVMQFFWREICFERDWFDKNCHFRSTYFYPAMKKSYARRRTSDCKRSCVKHSVTLCWSYLYTSFYLLLFLNSFLYLDTGLTKIANCPSTIILFRHSNMPSVKKCFTIVNYDFRVVI